MSILMCSVRVDFYNLAGVLLVTNTLGTLTSTWGHYQFSIGVPNTAAYMILFLFAEVGTANMTDVTLTRIMRPL